MRCLLILCINATVYLLRDRTACEISSKLVLDSNVPEVELNFPHFLLFQDLAALFFRCTLVSPQQGPNRKEATQPALQ